MMMRPGSGSGSRAQFPASHDDDDDDDDDMMMIMMMMKICI